MVLKLEKQEFVAELEDLYQDSSSVIVTHYHGLTVAQITSLRRNLRNNNAGFKVVKNTLSRIAASKTAVKSITDLFSGPSAIAFSKDPVAAAKIVVEFAKTNSQLKIIGGFVNGQILNAASVGQLAKLPSLDELKGQIVGLLQAPAVKIAGVLQAPAAQLARVVQAYANKNN